MSVVWEKPIHPRHLGILPAESMLEFRSLQGESDRHDTSCLLRLSARLQWSSMRDPYVSNGFARQGSGLSAHLSLGYFQCQSSGFFMDAFLNQQGRYFECKAASAGEYLYSDVPR